MPRATSKKVTEHLIPLVTQESVLKTSSIETEIIYGTRIRFRRISGVNEFRLLKNVVEAITFGDYKGCFDLKSCRTEKFMVKNDTHKNI
eukprot:snap_masked-scaffold_10-processed-gene-10.14-mRNA-1 protein AED:1.00 eAED:1.00 QI:0/-1/0/0/-1/1/1/0/88